MDHNIPVTDADLFCCYEPNTARSSSLPFPWCLKVAIGLILIAHFVVLAFHPALLSALFMPPYAVFLLLVLVGGGIEIWHHSIMWRARRRAGEQPHLVRRGGLFGRIRHPMYLGDAVLYVGLASYPATVVSLLALAVGLWALWRQAGREDRELGVVFGDEHRRWQQATGRFFPKRNTE